MPGPIALSQARRMNTLTTIAYELKASLHSAPSNSCQPGLDLTQESRTRHRTAPPAAGLPGGGAAEDLRGPRQRHHRLPAAHGGAPGEPAVRRAPERRRVRRPGGGRCGPVPTGSPAGRAAGAGRRRPRWCAETGCSGHLHVTGFPLGAGPAPVYKRSNSRVVLRSLSHMHIQSRVSFALMPYLLSVCKP